MCEFLILGCGYTARRVAQALAASGASVICTNRQKTEVPNARSVALNTADDESIQALSGHLSNGMAVLYSIPEFKATGRLLDVLGPFQPRRFVYISTTGVYGAAESVNEATVPAPNTQRDQERLQTEQMISSGPWSSLILRPAAIYGPDRGVHTSARQGVFRPPPGGNRVISRIHVDDLAFQLLAGLRSEFTGAFPIADEEPCTSLELAQWTCAYLGVPLNVEPQALDPNPPRGRRVDGSAYRRLLGLTLQYPTYRQGIPASLSARQQQ